jgi:alpha-L-fucosidase 2
MPPNLQGIWNGDRHPAWASDYHNDVNIQMNYWQAPIGGLTDMMLALFDYYDSLIPDFQHNAQHIMGCRGILMGVSQTLCGLASCHTPLWLTWTGGGAWIAQHYYDYWRYTGDDKFLRERALPFLREVALFYEDFVDISGDTAIVAPSISPENNPTDGQKTSLAVNATMDISLAREVLSNLIAGCNHLGIWQDDLPRWQNILDKLPAYEADPETGSLREWLYPNLTENHLHRHESHLYGVFPGEEIGPDHPMFEAVRISLEKRRGVGLNQQTGWSLGNMACVRTRLGDGDEAFDALEVLARSCVGSNLFTYHNDWRAQGNTMFWGHPHLKSSSAWGGNQPPFQIDANLCIPAAIMNMLLQVHGNTVSILPALPSAWKCGSVKGLCLPAGVKVDIDWADNKASVKLYGENAARYTLRSPFSLEIIH